MPITRAKKEEVVADIKKGLSGSDFIGFVNFHGLGIVESTALRKSLRTHGARYLVGKKTLIARAAQDENLELDKSKLEGEIAVVFGGADAVASAKDMAACAKKNKDAFKIIGGWFEKKWIEADMIKQLAAIPSREVLLGQLMSVINAPARGLVSVLAGPMRQLVTVLGQIKKVS